MPCRRLLPTVLVALAAAAQPLADAPAVDTATATRLRIVALGGDSLWNYDFRARDVARTGVDWPVALVFWDAASIDRVKRALPYRWIGGPMYARLDDGGGAVWDSDRGRKSSLCPITGRALHYRLYADGDDQLYSIERGYYVVGTVHYDVRECGLDRWSGRSEDAEAELARAARAVWGTAAVREDAIDLGNRERLRREGRHVWQSDGRATAVRVR